MSQYDADAEMYIVRDGGNLTVGSGGTSGNLYFGVKTFDKNFSKNIWNARVSYKINQNLFTKDRLSGEKFGRQFVEKMAADGIILGCPATQFIKSSTK